jgi:hypothetical protein
MLLADDSCISRAWIALCRGLQARGVAESEVVCFANGDRSARSPATGELAGMQVTQRGGGFTQVGSAARGALPCAVDAGSCLCESSFTHGLSRVVLAVVTVFGCMLTDMAHYGVVQLPKYRTRFPRSFGRPATENLPVSTRRSARRVSWPTR